MRENPLIIITSSYLDDAESHTRMKGRNLNEKALNKSLYR